MNPTTIITSFIPKLFDVGQFQVSMHLFKTPMFVDKYNSPPRLELRQGSTEYLHVGLIYQDANNDGTLQVLKLWATPDEQIENPTHHVIVDEECISTSALAVDEVTPSGSDPFIKYTMPAFKFPQSEVVYLHARVRICFPGRAFEAIGRACTKTCNRKRRSTGKTSYDEDDEIITIGPIYINNRGLNHGAAKLDMQKIITEREKARMIQLVFVICIAFIIVFVMIIIGIMLRNARDKKNSRRKSF